ncbi:hypothetical protein Tco_0001971 [Tanacetum coccineum]
MLNSAAAAVQAAVDAMPPTISRAVREEYRTGLYLRKSRQEFRWGLHKSILDHVMCIQFTDVAQVADAARNLEILRDRDDYDRSERSDKRHKSGDRYQSATQQNSYRGHDQKNDRQGSDISVVVTTRNNNNNNYSRDNNRNSGAGRDQKNRGQQSHRSTNLVKSFEITSLFSICLKVHDFKINLESGSQQSRDPLRTWSSSAGLQEEHCASSSGHADKKPDASSIVFALLMIQAANTLGYRQIISALKARTLLSHGCEGFLATIHDTTFDVSSIHDQPIVSEFQDVFPEELPGIPPIRDVEGSVTGVCLSDFIRPSDRHGVHRFCLSRRWTIDIDIWLPFIASEKQDISKLLFAHVLCHYENLGYAFWSTRMLQLQKRITMIRRRFEAITKWPRPTSVTESEKFEWNEEREKSFEELKQRLVSSPILTLPSGTGPTKKVSRSQATLLVERVGERILEGPEKIEVTMKSSPRFGIKGKLSPRFIGPFEILDRVGEVSYRLALPPQLSHVHNVFHVSLLRGEDQPNERTPLPPPRNKSLSPPQAPSKSISSKSTHYTSSSSPSESPTPTHVAPPPKLRVVIPIKLEHQDLTPPQISPNDPYSQTMDNWPPGPSNPYPPPRVSRPPPGFPNPPPRFEPLPSTQPLFVNINNNTPLLQNNTPPLENIHHPPPNLGNQDFPNPPNILDFVHPNDMPHLHNMFCQCCSTTRHEILML